MAKSGQKLLAATLVFGAGYLGALITPSGEGIGGHVVTRALRYLGTSSSEAPRRTHTRILAAVDATPVPHKEEPKPVIVPVSEDAEPDDEAAAPSPPVSQQRKRPKHERRAQTVHRATLPSPLLGRSEIIDPWASAER